MTQATLKKMYQLLLTEPHAPTVCAQLERIAREALAEHAMQEVQRLGQEIEQEPLAWKLVPIEPTYEMLKAMDECSTEGYDERLYAGHAASVYMAAVDVAPAPPQRKPLTDEQFISMVDCDGICIDPQLAFAIKEMVERAHGISELTPKESCHKCNDLGYYDDGHENDDGSMSGGNYVECERCKS